MKRFPAAGPPPYSAKVLIFFKKTFFFRVPLIKCNVSPNNAYVSGGALFNSQSFADISSDTATAYTITPTETTLDYLEGKSVYVDTVNTVEEVKVMKLYTVSVSFQTHLYQSESNEQLVAPRRYRRMYQHISMQDETQETLLQDQDHQRN
jgi:hypothetical protein